MIRGPGAERGLQWLGGSASRRLLSFSGDHTVAMRSNLGFTSTQSSNSNRELRSEAARSLPVQVRHVHEFSIVLDPIRRGDVDRLLLFACLLQTLA